MQVGFSIQDEAVDVARFAPHGAHYLAFYTKCVPPVGRIVVVRLVVSPNKCA